MSSHFEFDLKNNDKFEKFFNEFSDDRKEIEKELEEKENYII